MTIGRTRASVLIAGMILVLATASSASAAVANPYAKCFQKISKASQSYLKSKLKLTEILELGKATLDAPDPEAFLAHLQRMQLDAPQGLREELYQRLLLAGLQNSTGLAG